MPRNRNSSKVVEMRDHQQKQRKPSAEVKKLQDTITQIKTEVSQFSEVANREINELQQEVGQLHMSNRRQERVIRDLLQRLSQYENVENLMAQETPEKDEEGGDSE